MGTWEMSENEKDNKTRRINNKNPYLSDYKIKTMGTTIYFF